ncbi:acetyltransferase [Mariniflexile aquimaris]|uniref:Acetyltransferase n=1 Tax=Mariniflexile aquimaris TaxID=881009 RepID=A0ABW3BTQ0_9FLAO
MKSNTEKINIIIIGGSKLSQEIIESVDFAEQYHIVGVIALDKVKPQPVYTSNYPMYHGMSAFYELQQKHHITHGIVDLQDLNLKKDCIKDIQRSCKGFQFINLLHPSVVLGKNVQLGSGNIIGAKVIMNSDSTLGDFCWINNRVSIGHDSTIEPYVTIDTNATIGGNTRIGKGSYIGMSANIVNDITIAKHCHIEANTLVLRSVPANTKMRGIPATVVPS